jgi:hypothetical protein
MDLQSGQSSLPLCPAISGQICKGACYSYEHLPVLDWFGLPCARALVQVDVGYGYRQTAHGAECAEFHVDASIVVLLQRIC